MANKISISVVIISRNEERTIDRCIDSVITELKDYDSEIILVDSASTDKTITIAKQYPIKIIQLKQSKYLSPSAGRYVGTKYAKGEYILFIDSDVIMIKDFVKKVLKHFEKDVAGVRGVLFRVYPGESLNRRHKEKVKFGNRSPLWGQAAIYRRAALNECGTFNPFVKGEEERELELRLRKKKFKLLILDIPMCYHMEKQKNVSEIDEKAGYFVGVGQIMRAHFLRDDFWTMLRTYKHMYLHQLLILFAAAAVIVPLLFGLAAVSLIVLLVIILGIVALGWMKGFRKVYYFFRSRILTIINIIRGFLMGIKNAKEYDKLVSVKRVK